MQGYQVVCAALSSFIAVVCFVPYIRDIVRGTTKPHAYTWFIWSVLQGVAAVSMWSEGAGIAVAAGTIGTVLCAGIFILSLKYGTTNIKPIDSICLAGALLSLASYFFMHNPLLSIVSIVITDVIAVAPTFRKTYEEPHTETSSTHILSGFASMFALAALQSFTFASVFYFCVVMVLDFTLGTMIVVLQRKQGSI